MIITSLLFALTLTTDIEQTASKIDGVVGVAAVNLESGRSVTIHGDERFPMGSVFKFPVALEVLRRVDRGELRLDQTITIEPKDFSVGFSPIRDNAGGKAVTLTHREMLEAMLGASDNTAADVYLHLLGVPAVNNRLRDLGVTGIRIDRSEREMGHDLDQPGGHARYAADARDTATPNAALALLVKLVKREDGLSAASHDLAWKIMTGTKTGANRIKSILPPGATIAHKTGTMPGTVNDIGVITTPDGKHIAIAIFTKARVKAKDTDAEKVIAEIAKAVYAELTR